MYCGTCEGACRRRYLEKFGKTGWRWVVYLERHYGFFKCSLISCSARASLNYFQEGMQLLKAALHPVAALKKPQQTLLFEMKFEKYSVILHGRGIFRLAFLPSTVRPEPLHVFHRFMVP